MKIQINAYQKFLKHESKIYKIGDIRLYQALDLRDLGAAIFAFLFVLIVTRILPLLAQLPFIIKYAVLPLGIVYLFRKAKFDGKNTIIFIFDYIVYLFNCRQRYQFFKMVPGGTDGKFQIRWSVACRTWR